MAFRVEKDVRAQLEEIQRTEGIPFSFQIHQALVAWLAQRKGRAA